MNSLMKKDYMDASNTEMSVDNLWAADTYYDPYSSNSSVANETTQLVIFYIKINISKNAIYL